MQVLVGCESSGTVREAFRVLGYDAWSCDLLPADDKSPYHIQGDVRDAIRSRKWDLIILHPPCTALAVSGNRWYGVGKEKHQERIDAIKWTKELFELAQQHSPRVAMENPVGVLGSMGGLYPAQYVQPWMFGEEASKKTGLWLHGLPCLAPTNVVGKGEYHTTKSGKRLPSWYNLPPSEDRWKIRSKTFQGLANAMAQQWGAYCYEHLRTKH